MINTLKIAFPGCLLFSLQVSFAQVDTARKFIPKEANVADKKLKKEIQQKQLLEKPVQLNTAHTDTATDKAVQKKKPVKKMYRKKKHKAK